MFPTQTFPILLLAVCAFGGAADAQLLDATGTIRPGPAGAISHYDLTLTDTGNTTIGTFWYDQFAGLDFLASAPTTVESPPGWTSLITHNATRGDGFAIQWTATSPTSLLTPGSTLTGFGFDTTEPRDGVIGLSAAFPGFSLGTSVVNSGGPTSDPGAEIDITPVSIPGDANLDGKVDFSDLLILAQNFGRPGDFTQGNFNGDFLVNFADLLILAQNYGSIVVPGQAVAEVPEPSTASALVLLAVFGLRIRRRHRGPERDARVARPNHVGPRFAAKASFGDLPPAVRIALRRGYGFFTPRAVYEQNRRTG